MTSWCIQPRLGTTEGSQVQCLGPEVPPAGGGGCWSKAGPLWDGFCPEDRTWLHIRLGSCWAGFILIFFLMCVIKCPFYKMYHFNNF